jgi:peptidoglycan/LPS O-acetylase OafA/YrhL
MNARWSAPKLDIFYGIYLFAHPIQQLTASFPLRFWATGFVTYAITLGAGTASALLVEQPMLRMRERGSALKGR